MIRALHLCQNVRPPHPGSQPVGYEKIIDAPARVLFPGMEAVGPPAISSRRIGVEQPEGIGKARFCLLYTSTLWVVRPVIRIVMDI